MSAGPAPLHAVTEVAAPPAAVWEVVGDLARMAELSPELRRAWVLGEPGLGARVVGLNRRGPVAWPTLSRVVRWEPGRAVAWHVRESGATWVYELEPVEPVEPVEAAQAGSPGAPPSTLLTAHRVLPRFGLATRLIGPLIGGATGHDAELAQGLRTTLERIRDVVEA
ncbi:hypothetical protein GCM10027596_13690 [Nocardioides korecus]